MTEDKAYQEQRLKLLADTLKLVVDKNWWGIQLSQLSEIMQLGEWETQHLFQEYTQKDPLALIQGVFNPHTTQNQLSIFDVFDANETTHYNKAEVDLNVLASDPQTITYSYYHHFLGTICIADSEDGLIQITFEDEDPGLKRLVKHYPKSKLLEQETELQALALNQLLHIYQNNFESLVLPVAVKCTSFQLAVWQKLIELKPLETTTYGDLALELRDKNASRAVGTAIGLNPIALFIPCHRVINQTKKIGHFRWGTWRKQVLLGIEK